MRTKKLYKMYKKALFGSVYNNVALCQCLKVFELEIRMQVFNTCPVKVSLPKV